MFPSSALVNALQTDLGRDLTAFLPELILCTTIVVMLLMRLFTSLNRAHLGYVALAASIVSFFVALAQWSGDPNFDPGAADKLPIFTGLLVYDTFAVYVRLFLLGFLSLALWMTLITGIPDRDDSADFSTLLLGSSLGMMLMASANHLLMVFIAVEMASVPSYVLAGFLKGKKQGSEGALKYVVYGASASGVMLYGISLLAGTFGTGYLPDLAIGYQAVLKADGLDPVLAAGTLFVIVGLCFKLSAVPFHFWCPDVFEGASAEVAAFLSVASKGAAMALTARFLMTLGGVTGTQTIVLLGGSIGILLAVIAATTATLGNLAALGQTNLKRLLAYSTIAHAGYMLMALVPLSSAGASAVLFYLVAYLLMNLGAFAIIAFLRNQTGSEELSSYSGMIHRSPVLVVTLTICLLSLLGLPPLAGFAAKFQIFAVLFDSGNSYASTLPILSYAFYGLLILAGLNTVISAAYYLKVLRVMILDAPPADDNRVFHTSPGMVAFASHMVFWVLTVGILWNPLNRAADRAVEPFKPLVQPNPIQTDK